MGIKLHNPNTGKYAEAKDQAQFDRIFKPAGWVKADPSADGEDVGALTARIADLEARIEALEAAETAPEEDESSSPLPELTRWPGFDEDTAEVSFADSAEDAAPATRRRGRKPGAEG